MNKKISTAIVSLGAFLSLAIAIPASAQVTTNVSATVATPAASVGVGGAAHAGTSTRMHTRGNATSSAARMEAMQGRADTMIQARITTLTNLENRLNDMAKLSADEKSSLSTSLSGEISDLTSLEGTINTTQSTTTLRTDESSITKAYRIYMLVAPQASIAAASDRVQTIVSSLQTIGTKLQTRISTEQTAGTDVSSLTSMLADFNAKVTDAATQAEMAESETANLAPDNGDTTVEASNTAALKDARAKLQTAESDLKAAQKDAKSIITALKSTNTTVSATTSVQQ